MEFSVHARQQEKTNRQVKHLKNKPRIAMIRIRVIQNIATQEK